MKTRPFVQLKAAVSLDGCMADATSERLVLSSEEDARAVDALRATMDAIFIGAETLRKDNPQLLIRDAALVKARQERGLPAQPLRVVWTGSGRIPIDARLFESPSPILLVAPQGVAPPAPLPPYVQWRAVTGTTSMPVDALLEDLARHGVRRLLVEGGAHVLRQFLRCFAFDAFRLAMAPRLVGAQGLRLFDDPVAALLGDTLTLDDAEQLGDMIVLHLKARASRC